SRQRGRCRRARRCGSFPCLSGALMTTRRRTKILATLGPATDPPGVLEALFRAGVNVVRLNFSHGDPAGHAKRASEVRAAAQQAGVEVGILADLPGPKIRIERFAQGKVTLKAGDRFDLVAAADVPPGDATQVGVSYLGLPGGLGGGGAGGGPRVAGGRPSTAVGIRGWRGGAGGGGGGVRAAAGRREVAACTAAQALGSRAERCAGAGTPPRTHDLVTCPA